MASLRPAEARHRRPLWLVALLLVLAAVLFAALCALGIWQVERRAWKLDLIQRVEARINAAPVDAPRPSEWPRITAADHEYRRVTTSGRFLPDQTVFVQALTSLGGGFWAVTPLQTADGFTVLVNRGFVTAGERSALEDADPSANAEITGLLRLTEPGGGFLRGNDPAAGRWFSRDVEAIGEARGLSALAPYFIDAEAVPNAENGAPVGGLTVVSFNNNHLVYALTWFGLALMVLAAAIFLLRDESWLRRVDHP